MAQEKKYHYLDTPDGHDIDKKLWCVLKPAALTAFGLGTFDVLAWSHPKGYLPALGRYAYVAFPILGVSSTFVLVTNGAASLRKKDDRWNWFIGGFTAGTIMGAWTRRTIIGFNFGMFFGLLGVCRKIAAESGWTVSPPDYIPKTNRGIWTYDFSLMQERPRNWTTGNSEKKEC